MTSGVRPAAGTSRSGLEWLRGVSACLGVAAGLPVLGRMRRELLAEGRLHRSTTAAMYGVYTAHAAATAAALTRTARRAPLSRPAATGGAGLTLAGAGLTLAGAGLLVAGMSRFAGPGQLSGTDPASVVTSGVYRISRNPQYLGYVTALAGLGIARRSPAALALTGVIAAVYRWWVPVEERHLERTFGARYRTYRCRTPRWLGRAR